MIDPASWDAQRRLPLAEGLGEPPVVDVLSAGSRLHRIHRTGRDGAEFNAGVPGAFSGGRFDCTDGSYGVLYAADTPDSAVAETVLRDTPLVDRGARVVPFARVAGRALALLETRRDLRLASLHGAAAAAIGQGLWLTKSDATDYPLTREWARAIHDDETQPDGLIWRPRFDEDGLAVVLFGDRCAEALAVVQSLPIDAGPGLEGVRRVLLDHRAVIEG